ncbi:hypothetical protein SHEWT2_00769 [Shewanella hafniensis]|nr:hypothetical protein SHEWT2_00769 [Shewanella hafniensis]
MQASSTLSTPKEIVRSQSHYPPKVTDKYQ